MEKFPRYFRSNLRTSRGGLVVSGLVIIALILVLVAAYSVFDLGAVFPKRRP